ncbi:MAG: hypothetical protein HYR63_07645 [Proteobacteria bacterium]|nr:hypothetical protein [Pseudomonadota bacterium]
MMEFDIDHNTPGTSLLAWSAGQRLLLVLGILAMLWLAVLWALTAAGTEGNAAMLQGPAIGMPA